MTEVMGGDGAILAVEWERAEEAGRNGTGVILVEGVSDQRAIETLAPRVGRDLADEDVAVIPAAGATNFWRFLELLGPNGYDVSLVGMCDQGEEAELARALTRAGLGEVDSREDLEDLGFYVCTADLEDEMIRALGHEVMLSLIESQGHTRRLRSFQNQVHHRDQPLETQIWQWLGNHKIRYAPLLAGALPLDAIPRPLLGVLGRV
ncbi:MAG TPA: TOPRIM nucleotidyl transferase/hydrolase domain-containing protein [Acidimicrobiia bacterium]|jgi:hypothetical protein|nr:TOPRIM nucleotidyl transferase/hydrolase domain-containing protein [Acidimicrobiia bacterium]